MSIRRFFDEIQLRLHVLGLHNIAMFFGRWGTKETEPRLRIINFDPLRYDNPDIDIEKDIAWPKSKLDVN